jgi:hypothetical protein
MGNGREGTSIDCDIPMRGLSILDWLIIVIDVPYD